ncbi:MAG TPA: hypothetical protein VIL18_03145, partial [Longimicrobiales bacterium]
TEGRKANMGKIGRGTSWKEHRLMDRLEIDGRTYTVDLVARRATGVQGYRMTIVYLAHDGAEEREIPLPNASTNAEVNRAVRELAGQAEILERIFREGRGP